MTTSRLEELQALRDLLKESLHECPAYSRAPLAAQYRATLTEIAELEGSVPIEDADVTPIERARIAREERLKRQTS